MTTSQRLELPADVAHNILSMLTPKERPFAVLCVWPVDRGSERIQARLLAESVSEEERKLLELQQSAQRVWTSKPMWLLFDLVHTALALGFVFRTEADRARWRNGEAFEMYRAAVRTLE